MNLFLGGLRRFVSGIYKLPASITQILILTTNKMEMQISTGNYEIIGSGTIVGNYNELIKFEFSSLTYIFEFPSDLENLTTRLEFETMAEKTLKLKFINFNNSLGQGPAIPTNIGNVNNRKLFINYRVYTLTEGAGKTIHYTFLLEKEVGNGE